MFDHSAPSREKEPFRISLRILIPGLTFLCLIVLLIPTFVVIHFKWQQMLLQSCRDEAAVNGIPIADVVSSELARAAETVSSFIFAISVMQSQYSLFPNASFRPFVQRFMSACMSIPNEQTVLVNQSIFLYVADPVAVIGAISSYSWSDSGNVFGVYDVAELSSDKSSSNNMVAQTVFNASAPSVSVMGHYSTSHRDLIRAPRLRTSTGVRLSLAQAAYQGSDVFELRGSLNILPGMLGAPQSTGSEATLSLADVIMRYSADSLEAMMHFGGGAPTPESHVYLAYEELILRAIVPASENHPPFYVSVEATTPLRTPGGYDCFVDASGANFASCFLLTSTQPLLNDYLSQGASVQPVVVRNSATDVSYFCKTVSVVIPRQEWGIELGLHILTPVSDLENGHATMRPMYATAVVLLVFIVAVATVLAHRLTTRIVTFYETCATVMIQSRRDAYVPPPPQHLSVISELHTAQTDLLRMLKRVLDIGNTLSWLKARAAAAPPFLNGSTSRLCGVDDHPRAGGESCSDVSATPKYSNGLRVPSELDIISESAASHSTNTSNIAHSGTSSVVEPLTTGKATNAFLLLHIKRRSLDPTLEVQSVVFSLAFNTLQRHGAVIESVNQFNVMASFRSKQHALRAVECARVLTAALDGLPASSCGGDDVRYFIACDVGLSVRWHATDVFGTSSFAASGASPATPPAPPSATTCGGGGAASGTNNVVFRNVGKKSLLTVECCDLLPRLMALQSSLLRSRLILTDRLVMSLPQRVASVLTPVDYLAFHNHSPHHPAAAGITEPEQQQQQRHPLVVQLYEDPVVERVMRTPFMISRRLTLGRAFQHMVEGNLAEALEELKDFTGDPQSQDVCNWHVYRWRRWIALIQSKSAAQEQYDASSPEGLHSEHHRRQVSETTTVASPSTKYVRVMKPFFCSN